MTRSIAWPAAPKRLSRIAAVARSEALRLVQDRVAISLIALVPLVQIVLFGYAVPDIDVQLLDIAGDLAEERRLFIRLDVARLANGAANGAALGSDRRDGESLRVGGCGSGRLWPSGRWPVTATDEQSQCCGGKFPTCQSVEGRLKSGPAF